MLFSGLLQLLDQATDFQELKNHAPAKQEAQCHEKWQKVKERGEGRQE